MKELVAFRRQILAVAADSKRSLEMPRPVIPTPVQLPAFGAPSPVLLIGTWPKNIRQDDSSWKSVEVIVADDDPVRLDATVSSLQGIPLTNLRVLHAEAENLKLDLGSLSRAWNANPPRSYSVAREFMTRGAEAAEIKPAIPDESCSIVYCNSVSGRRSESQRINVVREVYRVLRRGGAATFFIDLADEPSMESACTEGVFSQILADTGYYAIRIVDRSPFPVSVSDGIEVYSYVFEAFKGKEGPCLDCRQAVIYRGPWKKVFDDDGHVFERDVRTAVCEKTLTIMTASPYSKDFFVIEPHIPTPPSEAATFSCSSATRSPQSTKTSVMETGTTKPSACC